MLYFEVGVFLMLHVLYVLYVCAVRAVVMHDTCLEGIVRKASQEDVVDHPCEALSTIADQRCRALFTTLRRPSEA